MKLTTIEAKYQIEKMIERATDETKIEKMQAILELLQEVERKCFGLCSLKPAMTGKYIDAKQRRMFDLVEDCRAIELGGAK